MASRLFWSSPNDENSEERPFPFDVGDFLGVALFVYLTDVEPSMTTCQSQFGSNIRVVTGV